MDGTPVAALLFIPRKNYIRALKFPRVPPHSREIYPAAFLKEKTAPQSASCFLPPFYAFFQYI